MKSFLSELSKYFISGIDIITLGFPPYLGSLAVMSPIVLETLNFPGDTLNGPTTDEFLIFIVVVLLVLTGVVVYDDILFGLILDVGEITLFALFWLLE